MSPFRTPLRHPLLWISATTSLLLAAYWLLEAAEHVVFQREGIAQALLPRNPEEIWMRMFTAAVIATATFLSSYLQLRRLRESEEQFRSITETASDAIVTVDREGRIVTWNRAAEAIFGYRTGEAIGSLVSRLVPSRFTEGHRQGMAKILSSAAPGPAGGVARVVGLRKNAMEFPAELSFSRWDRGGETFLTAIIRDVSEITVLRESAARARQLEVVGKIAAGVAHEVRNPLHATGYRKGVRAVFHDEEGGHGARPQPRPPHRRTARRGMLPPQQRPTPWVHGGVPFAPGQRSGPIGGGVIWFRGGLDHVRVRVDH